MGGWRAGGVGGCNSVDGCSGGGVGVCSTVELVGGVVVWVGVVVMAWVVALMVLVVVA